MNEFGLSIQQMVLVMTLVEYLLADVAAVSIQAVHTVLVENQLALKRQLLFIVMVQNADPAYFRFILEVGAILYFNQFSNSPNSKIFLEYKLFRIVKLLKIHSTLLQMFVEKV